jgi:hypothetical protein
MKGAKRFKNKSNIDGDIKLELSNDLNVNSAN